MLYELSNDSEKEITKYDVPTENDSEFGFGVLLGTQEIRYADLTLCCTCSTSCSGSGGSNQMEKYQREVVA